MIDARAAVRNLLRAALFPALALSACMPQHSYQAVCRHYALVECSVAQEAGFRSRVAVGRTADGGRHATGQAMLRPGQWVDLEFWGGYVIPSRAPELARIDTVYTLTQWSAVLEAAGLDVEPRD